MSQTAGEGSGADAGEGDELLLRLRQFHSDYFPRHQQRFQDLVAHGQHPKTLFIGCSDSRLVPYLLTGAGPGELAPFTQVQGRIAGELTLQSRATALRQYMLLLVGQARVEGIDLEGADTPLVQ